ncbi:MAG: PA2779 family protein [Candidatus Omnitrophota bacterium]
MLKTIFKIKPVYVVVIIALFAVSVYPHDACAIPVKSKEALYETRLQDIEKILSVFKHDAAQKRLLSFKVNEADLRLRLERLSDSQLKEFARNATFVNAGGSAGGVIVAVVFVVLLIVAILYLTDYSVKVEPKKHK